MFLISKFPPVINLGQIQYLQMCTGNNDELIDITFGKSNSQEGMANRVQRGKQ